MSDMVETRIVMDTFDPSLKRCLLQIREERILDKNPSLKLRAADWP